MARRILLIEIGSGLTLKGLIPSVALYGTQSGSVKADGGVPPYSFTITAGLLPDGVYLDRATGLFSGSPTEAGDFPITVKATDLSGASIERPFLVKVIAEPLTLSGAAPDGTVGVAQSYTYAVAGGIPPYTYALVDAPPGWSVPDPSAPTIDYTAETGGSLSWTLRATDSNGDTFDKNDAATFGDPALTLSGAFAAATVGTPYSSDLAISGGDGTYSNPRVTVGSLSGTGLALTIVGSALRLSGTPAGSAGTLNITVAVDSGDGQTAASDQSIAISDGSSVSLLHFDGADGSTTFTDEYGKVWTPYGNAQISDVSPIYGSGSLALDGASFLTTPGSTDFYLSGGDFCIDASIVLSALPIAGDSNTDNQAFTIVALWEYTNGGLSWAFWIEPGALTLALNPNGGNASSYYFRVAWNPVVGTKYDLRVNVKDLVIRFFADGEQIGADQPCTTTINDVMSRVFIGARAETGNYRYFFKGKIDELRISKGQAHETTTYVPAVPWAA